MDKIIKFYRNRMKYTQKEVAQYLGITPQRYFVIENTDNLPEKYLEQLCTLFKVRKNILFKLLAAKNKYIAPEEVTYYRKQKGLTKQQLAAELNTYHTYIYSWESGKFTPGTDNAELLMNYLEIPDYIIFPDIVEYSSEHLVLELEDYFLVVGKEPFKYIEQVNNYCKEVKYAYLFSDRISDMLDPTTGERPLFPRQLQTDPETLMFEFENQLLIITPYLLSEEQMSAIRLNTEKEIIFALDDKILFLILSLKEKTGNYFFYNDFESELKGIFSTVTLHETERKIICSNTNYLCIITYEQANNEVILIDSVDISFLN